MNLSGRTALVTGAAKRVGKSIALELAKAGCDVLVHFRTSEAEAAEVAREIQELGRKCGVFQADLGNTDQLEAMLLRLRNDGWQVDILINGASVFYKSPLPEITPEVWEENLGVNVRAPFLLSRGLGLEMKARGVGKIVNIADAATRRPYRNYLPYLVSKAALVSLTEVLALELAPEVQVNTVSPGTVAMPDWGTPEMEQGIIRRTPLARIGSPEDVARMVVYLCEHGDFMTGGVYPVDGGAGL